MVGMGGSNDLEKHMKSEVPYPGGREVCGDAFCFSTLCNWGMQVREVTSEELKASR